MNYNADSDESLTDSIASDAALEGITFSVKKGETVGIIGGTGSGKSSLVSLIPRLYDATNGMVKIFGKDIEAYDIDSLRKHIGIVLQKAVMFKGTIESNVAYGEKTSKENLIKAVDLAVATDVVNAKGGFDSIIEQGGKNLSGGQRQRLSIARALAKNPDILILDDSASALDYATEKKLNANIKSFRGKNITTFIVTQRTSSILHADKIIVLDDGKIENIGTHEELLNKSSVYKEIYETQFGEEANNE